LQKKKWTGTYKKEFNVVIDEVEPFDLFYRKKVIFGFKSEIYCFYKANKLNYFFESIALH